MTEQIPFSNDVEPSPLVDILQPTIVESPQGRNFKLKVVGLKLRTRQWKKCRPPWLGDEANFAISNLQKWF